MSIFENNKDISFQPASKVWPKEFKSYILLEVLDI
jgi:hypothetical protein